MSENKNKVIHLEATYNESVKQNKANVTVLLNAEGKTRLELQKKLKELHKKFVTKIEKHDQVQSQVVSQNINQKVDKEYNVMDEYVGFISVNILSYDFNLLNKVLEEIEDVAEVNNIVTSISSSVMKEKENELIKKAITEFSDKAKLITESFGFTSYILEDIIVSSVSAHQHLRNMTLANISASSGSVSSQQASNLTNLVTPREEKLGVQVKGSIILTTSALK